MRKKVRKLFLDYIPALVKTGISSKAPFLYPILEIQPRSCLAMITDRCNSRCLMCRQWRESKGGELQTRDWKRIIEDLKRNGIRSIHFSGGEPLLRDDLEELISFSSGKGFAAGLTTNGLLLNRNSLDGFVKAGLRSIVLSLDALGSDYDRVRGIPDSFRKAKVAATLIADMRKKKGIDASINFTLMKDTLKTFRDVKRFADSLSMPLAVCLLDKNSYIFDLKENRSDYWIDRGEDIDRFASLLKDEKKRSPGSLLLNFPAIEYIRRYFSDPRQEWVPCASSQDRIVIDPYGNLLGGCLSMGTFGDISKTGLKTLRNTERYKRAKRNMFFKRCAGCSCGYVFNIRCMPGLIAKDAFARAGSFIFKKDV